jgi:hypothetical protein
MADQERIEGEEVEAHRRKVKYQAAEAAPEEVEGEGDDVEAHQLRRPPTSGD